MKFLLIALVLLLYVSPVYAAATDDLAQALVRVRSTLSSEPNYAQYLEDAARVTSALDVVIYSKAKIAANPLSTARFVNKQLRALEEAWALRYRIGIKNLQAPEVVGFSRTNILRVRRAFAAVDPKLRIDDYAVESMSEGGSEYRNYAFDRLIRTAFGMVSKNIDTTITRLK